VKRCDVGLGLTLIIQRARSRQSLLLESRRPLERSNPVSNEALSVLGSLIWLFKDSARRDLLHFAARLIDH